MPISDDWSFDYANLLLVHVDGVLSYDGGTAGQAAVGDYVYGADSGATGKVIAVTGNAASGTYTLTNVDGLFEDNEAIELCSNVNFDAVTASNGGFAVGDTIVDQVTGSVDVQAIEYNKDGAGGGTIWGNNFTAFTNDSQLDISGGQTDVADADGTGTDNDVVIDTALVAGTLAVPGTADTNDSAIIHYDAGTVLVPEQAIIEGVTSGETGLVEQQYGPADGSVGSLRIVDSDFGGSGFVDDETLRVQQVVNYDNQVGGEVFSVGNIVVGSTSGATGRVIGIVILTSTTGRLILADESGTWDFATPDNIQVDSVTIAEVADGTFTLNVSTANLPAGTRTEQRPTAVGGSVDQGGIYIETESLNIVRKFNSLYTLSQDTFDELAQMDDDEALDAAFKGFAYSLVFGWQFEENTLVSGTRFLRQGALIDSTGAEVWANAQTQGAINKVTDTAFLEATAQTFKQPQIYIEQNAAKVRQWWLEGNIDVLLKVRTRSDPRFVDHATPGLGQLINGGDPQSAGFYAVFSREFYTSTYDATEVNGSAGVVNSVALTTLPDVTNNNQGTHTMNWNTGSAATLLVGEEFELTTHVGNDNKVGIVVAQTGDGAATGTLEYVLKSGTQFLTTEAITARVSGKTLAVNGAPTSVVAGFDADIRLQVLDIAATPSGGTGITGKFVHGDLVTQASTAATGYLVLADTATDILYIEVVSGTFSGDNDITGSVSGSWDAGTGATYPSDTDFPADLNNGEGAFQYCGTMSGDITDANAESMQNLYQWSKYLARAEEDTYTVNGPGTADAGTVGRFFRRLSDAFTEIKPGNPFGLYTGSFAMAQGWFLDTDFILAADIRSFSVVDHTGVTHEPPNLQALTVTNVDTGWRVAVYRSASPGSTVIQRTEFDVGAVGGGFNQAGDSTILLAAGDRTVSPLPADVPDIGICYVLSPNSTGNYIPMNYSSIDRTNNELTLTGTIGSFLTAAGETSTDLVAADDAHIAFILETAAGTTVSNTIQYVADINLIIKARLKGFKPFRTTGTFSDTGASIGVVQTADTIVDLP